MHPFDITLPTPAENLAFDEAMLEWAEKHSAEGEFLRLWESALPMVVVGRSSRVAAEVNEPFCRQSNIPILRRSSGGAAIVTGPGCLMYAVVLSYAVRPDLRDITRAHAFVLKQLATSLSPLLSGAGDVMCAGTSDLAISGELGSGSWEQEKTPPTPRSSLFAPRKFSGNSLRVRRTHLLYHGTLLYDFDLGLIEKCLSTAPRQPEYRKARTHGDFVTNAPATRQQLVDAVITAFPMAGPPVDGLETRVAKLVAERFGNGQWNYEFA